MIFRSLNKLSVSALLLALPGCATLTSGTSQGLTIITEPAGAACTIQREGAVIGVVNPTPGTVQLSKSSKDLAVTCARGLAERGMTTVPAKFEAMTAGNILIGGLIGLAVDAASGAAGGYPESVVVALAPMPAVGAPPLPVVPAAALPGTPAAVPAANPAQPQLAATTPAVLPAMPAALSATPEEISLRMMGTRRAYDERIAAIRDACDPSQAAECATRAKALEAERDAELLRLNAARKAAGGA